MEDEPGDMIEERLDLAIRIGEITHPSVIKRSLGTAVRIAVATPGYIELQRFAATTPTISSGTIASCVMWHAAMPRGT